MSDFEEFCKAWKAEFPAEDLPTVWDEDIGTNLQRHKKNLEYLKSEVRKEEFYVTFLEKLVLNGQEKSHKTSNSSRTSTGSRVLNSSDSSTATFDSPKKNGKADFVTVISISNKETLDDDQSKTAASKSSAPPPKPPKQYSRSVSSDNSCKAKPEDIIAWTKQQIQQLQSKQGFKIEESSQSPLPSSSYENVATSSLKHRTSYENVGKTKSSYENVFTGPTLREKLSDEPDSIQPKVPVTDIDFEHGRVARTSALFQQHLLPKFPSGRQQPSSPQPKPTAPSKATTAPLPISEAFYDSVPHEENVSYIDAEDYIYLLDKPEEVEKTKERERTSTLKSFSSNTSDDSSGTGSLRRRLYANLTSLDGVETTRSLTSKQQLILKNFFDGEESYVAALSLVLDYKKALSIAVNSSQPVLSKDEIANIFFHIPQLHAHHTDFLQQIKSLKVSDWNLIQVAQLLKIFSENALPDYAIFLSNVKEALETTRKACQNSVQFGDLARRIRLRVNNQPQAIVSLEDLLHRPVARIQRHVAVIQDLIDVSSQDEPAYVMLQEAQQVTKAFLSEFSANQLQSLFPIQAASKTSAAVQPTRHLVKNGFLVELQADGKRKQRHVFLFTDMLVCTKYKGVGVHLEVKWFLPLAQVSVSVDESVAKISVSAITNVVSLRSQAAAVRTQMERSSAGAERQRKKLASLEAKLLLDSPNLPLRFSFKPKGATKFTQSFTFLLSSEYERTLWVEAFETLKRNLERLPPITLHAEEVESQIKACRTAVEPPTGSVKKSSLPAMNGEIQLVIQSLKGLHKPSDVYVVIELDSYGHYFHKARTKMAVKTLEPRWEEDFDLELEGARGLRVLVYEEDSKQVAVLRGKAELELSLAWLKSLKGPQQIPLNHQKAKATPNGVTCDELSLCITLRYLSHDVTLRRPAVRPTSCTIFGVPIDEVCQREKRQIPHIITCCTREIERRGLEELGIYRVSGLATDIARLRKAFDTRGAETDAQLREADVNSVSGLLKLYLRQLPEALFTDRLYPRFLEAFSKLDAAASLNGGEDMEEDSGVRALTQLFSSLPQLNQNVILYLLDHLVRVNAKEIKNKMSLHNLATIFGPTLLRPAPSASTPENLDQLALSTIDVMAQAGILHFFLLRRARRMPIHGPPVVP